MTHEYCNEYATTDESIKKKTEVTKQENTAYFVLYGKPSKLA